MIVVTGDGFAAASYANSNYSWCAQDQNHLIQGLLPHPANIPYSFAAHLSKVFHQPYICNACEIYSSNRVFEIANTFIDSGVDILVVVFPALFKNHIMYQGKAYYYRIDDVESADHPPEILKLIIEQYKQTNLTVIYNQFDQNLSQLCNKLAKTKTKYCLVMGESNLKTHPNIGNWLLDPSLFHIRAWAKSNNLLNEKQFLTKQGQIELAKLITKHLTSK